MNSTVVAGNVARAELKYLSNGDPILEFSVADSKGKEKPTLWWNCSLFGQRAETMAQYVEKGTSVTVSGVANIREYVNKQGENKWQLELRVAEINLNGGGKRDDNGGRQSRPAGNQRRNEQFDDIDDLPFE